MIVRILLIAILLAAAARSAFQGWNSYRRHRVRLSYYSDQFMARQSRPRLYWAAMTLHALLVAVFVGSALALALELMRHSG
ncbi:hypothetical protein [Lichenicoccus sp.]|uniref:hypothetical protein n=1 Tax=Lichenicoccus sp. TaxID=2781899 RepID=UPI003D147E9B